MTDFVQQCLKLVVTGSTGGNSPYSASSVSVSGNTLAVGGPKDDGDIGATWIFTRSSGVELFTQQQILIGTGNVGDSRQGTSVSLSSSDGNTLAVGGRGDDGSVGATWIFTRTSFGNPFYSTRKAGWNRNILGIQTKDIQ